jgi:selenide,water dikinase
MQERTLAEIIDSASEIFSDAGAEIVGGHTTTGSELTLGFTITGLAAQEPITVSGAQPGDVLILTRPIGSGTILAAEMRLKARGPQVTACLAEMARPQGAAAAALAKANAMTDVTGFGLAGHLLNILSASGVGATLDLDAIPLYAGAETLAAAGIRSTIWEANRAAAGIAAKVGDSPRETLLFDPQTAGGLLAAIAPRDAKKAMEDIEKAGFSAAIIGEITEGPPILRPA